MLRPKLVMKYVKQYLAEMTRLVSQVPRKYRILLPDHLVANQEVEIYITRKTGVAIDYVGLNSSQKITMRGSEKCFDDLLFPPTEYKLPCSQGALRLKPLSRTNANQPTATVKLMGDMSGIVLFRVKGGGHLFAYDQELMASSFGRHTLFNIYVQREHSDGSLESRYVRYAELHPDKNEMFTPLKAVLNARSDLKDYYDFVRSKEMGPTVQKYVRIGDAVHQLKDNSVVVLGKDTPLLRRIRDELRTLNYNAFLVKEQPNLPSQSPEEKVKLYTLMSKFAVMEDSVASGHIAEFEYCKNNRVVFVILRQKGRGSTWMIGDAPLVDINYIASFEYTERSLHAVLVEAAKWAESFIQRRVDSYRKRFPWTIE